MAIHHTSAGEVVDLHPLGQELKCARTTALVKTKLFEAVRLIVRADATIATHQVPGPITLHCLEGRVLLGLDDSTLELSSGQWLYLDGGERHSVKGVEDSSLLLTILFERKAGAQERHDPKARSGRRAASARDMDALLEEGLMGTFPASDPVAVCQPSTRTGTDVPVGSGDGASGKKEG